ncbi:ABC transporter ATP-binding protein [Ensifer sesbaniae]|jgi:branched-chain amino acid transport system ATP-binding protein|uniref:ABC transporter ATP-binding protein n=1 Tax=Ensifer sesbaniae TaxID=1214071 RepID=UPI001569B118|nr:ABC transporter ATP-binding protein [Ensifer sesbaniae]MCK3777214.1 ABC transporter ATP-binding protein [Ensifer sesbaniae]NRQ17320.1 Lipopolysaccharide export system ATP-binding protein LptB [Ensifer sesbaniae]
MSLLELERISKRFGALTVADEISFSVGEGEALGIIGPNGAGKSTLFNLIAGNIAPDSGTVRFGGMDVTRTPPMGRCLSGMGRTFQIPQPFEKLTVFENLLVAGSFGARRREAEACDRCAEILVDTGLFDKANVLAGGLTLLQRKRLELARALATEPRLLLLDEIAGGLTEAECHQLVATISAIQQKGVAVIWIEHVLHALTSVVERLLVLNFGKVIGIGKPDELMASRAVQEIYLGIEL